LLAWLAPHVTLFGFGHRAGWRGVPRAIHVFTTEGVGKTLNRKCEES
jgi:hypothetical protein